MHRLRLGEVVSKDGKANMLARWMGKHFYVINPNKNWAYPSEQ